MGVWGALIQGGLGIDSSIQEGQAEKRQADRNTALAQAAAADALVRGGLEGGAARQAGTELAARQHVAFANSGVDASVGTAANVQAATRARAELEAKQLENDAAREAWGYRKHGLDFQTQAGLSASRRGREIAGTALSTAGAMGAAHARGKKGGGSGWGFS